MVVTIAKTSETTIVTEVLRTKLFPIKKNVLASKKKPKKVNSTHINLPQQQQRNCCSTGAI